MPRFHAPTPGTRIAAWLFPAITIWMGTGYVVGPSSRLQSPAYEAARSWCPMWVWGLIFLAVALFKIGCLLLSGNDARPFVIAMCAGMGLYASWSVFIAASVLANDRTSYSAPALAVGWALMHVAVLATITDWHPSRPVWLRRLVGGSR